MAYLFTIYACPKVSNSSQCQAIWFFKKNLFFICLVMMTLSISWNAFAKIQSKSAPISITTCADFQNRNTNLNGQYLLVNDIDCNGVDFSPLGNFTEPLFGRLEGSQYKISNLSVLKNSSSYVGLFGDVSDVYIDQLIFN